MTNMTDSQKLPQQEDFDVTATYSRFLTEDPEMTMPVAAIESLVTLLSVKQTSTSSELIKLLAEATDTLKKSVPNSISLSAGCDLFMRFVLRNNLSGNWEECKNHLVENGKLFVERSKASRDMIAEYGLPFIKDDDLILVHSHSRAVLKLLLHAASKFIRFKVICTEARPSNDGIKMTKLLRENGIPVSIIVDSAVGSVIHKVDKVFMGAEGVAETGGIINYIGTYSIGVLSSNAHKPFYVVSESHKFVRLFPLAPDDLGENKNNLLNNFSTKSLIIEDELKNNPILDFTPHEYITALITDLGVLTPSGVSEELIKMWYD